MRVTKDENSQNKNKPSICSIKVLIITYYWPPAGGPGVQRWLKFVTYFSAFGIEPIVYIPENPQYPILDESTVSEIPSGIEILKQPIKEPYRIAGLFSKKKTKQISSGIITNKKQSFVEKLMLWIRGNFFIPDARIAWVKPSLAFLQNYIKENEVAVIITTGPPHSLHLIGLALKDTLKLPWIADFRDPWTSIHYHKSLRLSKSSEKKHKDLESLVLHSADSVVVTSPSTKKEFEKITDTPIEVITNGYDISEKIIRIPDKSFSIVHIGSLLSERNPEVLWKVLSEIASENESFASDLKIRLVGTVSEDILDSIQTYGLQENCNVLGYVSHQEAIQLQHNAQVLLLVEIDRPETKAIIPGKVFEYLAAERPILALGPEGSDVIDIISETNSGHYFTYYEEEKLRKQILTFYKEFKNESLAVNSQNISKYSRRELTARISALIKKLITD